MWSGPDDRKMLCTKNKHWLRFQVFVLFCQGLRKKDKASWRTLISSQTPFPNSQKIVYVTKSDVRQDWMIWYLRWIMPAPNSFYCIKWMMPAFLLTGNAIWRAPSKCSKLKERQDNFVLNYATRRKGKTPAIVGVVNNSWFPKFGKDPLFQQELHLNRKFHHHMSIENLVF